MLTIRKMKSWSGYRQKGFSLIELCIAIALVAVISAIMIPLGLSMRQRYQLRSSAPDVMSAVKRAQTEAVKRGSRVAIVFVMGTPPAGGTCTVFADDGEGGGVLGNLIQDGTEQGLYVTTVQTGNTLQVPPLPAPPNPSPLNSAEFSSSGLPIALATPVAIDVTRAGLSVQYRITLSVTGRVSLQVSTDSGATWN